MIWEELSNVWYEQACLFGFHKWNGGKCERCGATKTESHLQKNDENSLDGTELVPVTSFTSDEMDLIFQIMVFTQEGGKQTGEKDIESHAKTLVMMFIAKIGNLTQSDIGFISKYTAMYVSALGDAGRKQDAAKYGKLLRKLIELDDNASPIAKSLNQRFIGI